MMAVLNQTRRTTKTDPVLGTVRRCLVCGESKPKSDLIRFVLDSDGWVVPDLACRLPGRGLWVSADREALQTAIAKNLFSRAAKAKAKVDPALLQQVERLFARRCSDLLGLARAASAIVTREPLVLESLAAGKLEAVLLASDAGGDIRKKLSRAPVLFGDMMTREELGAALGREHLAVAGLRAHPLTEKLQEEMKRWHGVRASEG